MSVLNDTSSRRFAQLAGAQYVLIAFAGFFSILWVPGQLTVPGDPLATAAQIAARPGLFLAGVAGDLVMMTAEVVLSVMLYAMFRPFGAVLALAATVARLMMAAIMAVMMLPQAGVLALATDSLPLVSMDAAERADLAWVLAEFDRAGVWMWQVFFTLHLWLLGILAWRSGVVPRVLAGGLVLGGTGYLVDSLRAFAFPDSAVLGAVGVALLAVVTVAEIGFALWLLLRSPGVGALRGQPVAG